MEETLKTFNNWLKDYAYIVKSYDTIEYKKTFTVLMNETQFLRLLIGCTVISQKKINSLNKVMQV